MDLLHSYAANVRRAKVNRPRVATLVCATAALLGDRARAGVGDPLLGGVVMDSLMCGRNALNDAGQVVFQARIQIPGKEAAFPTIVRVFVRADPIR